MTRMVIVPNALRDQINNLLGWADIAWWAASQKPRSFRAFFCRLRGHRCGVFWYNPGGWAPDMHCKNCGDDLG